jgi:Uma2 family endonuclease
VSTVDPVWTLREYERAAQEYLESLPPEHFMEPIPQATQREVTLASPALLKPRRPLLQVYNELLVQYFFEGRLRRVVPDNAGRESARPVCSDGSYNLELEGEPPFIVMEYVSKSNKRKDYKDNYQKYRTELKVPYYLLFDPETKDLRLYRHNGRTYRRTRANAAGRFEVVEWELEVGLLDGWVRYWHRGEQLELPAELQLQLDNLKERVRALEASNALIREEATREKQRAEQEKRDKEQEKQQRLEAEAEVLRLRALLEQLQGPRPTP